MPKKKTYKALQQLFSESKQERILPGETIQLYSKDAKVLLDKNIIEEVEDGADNERDELGELQDRTE